MRRKPRPVLLQRNNPTWATLFRSAHSWHSAATVIEPAASRYASGLPTLTLSTEEASMPRLSVPAPAAVSPEQRKGRFPFEWQEELQ